MGNVKAGPTKEFFIDMITRDIQLDKAILDLIDNSIDGAKKIGNLDSKKIEIHIEKDKFEIIDNCGGFSSDIASNYAFKFGRVGLSKAENFVDYSIGRFGIGMKRTLFKLGKKFVVESRTESEHFKISVDVDAWKDDEKSWEFDMVMCTDDNNENWKGTKITVTQLNEDVKESFIENTNISLINEIGYSYAKLIKKGMKITVNKVEAKANEVKIIMDNKIKPSIRKFKVGEVNVTIIAGICEAKPSEAGWYIYANDRLLLMSDKSKITGWGIKNDDMSLPQFHASKAMFRGVVFMESKDVTKLPLTTTKVGVDVDSEIYKTILQNIGIMMKEIFIFLNKINDKEYRNTLYLNHEHFSAFYLKEHYISKEKQKFICLEELGIENEKEIKISFTKPKKIVDKIKCKYNLNTNKEVGEYAFNYLVDMECLE